MTVDERFEGLLDDLSGFYRSWLVYLGLELDLLKTVYAAGEGGMTSEDVALAARCALGPVDGWCRAAYAYRLLELVDPEEATLRFSIDPGLAAVLLDEELPEYLGGQFVFTVGASIEHGGMVEFFRTGEPLGERSTRFHRAVEKLNAQDTVLFMEEALPKLPDVAERLRAGGSALDVACGGAGWMIAMAWAFPEAQFVGVEFDPDWLERAQTRIRAEELTDRVAVEPAAPERLEWTDRFDLVYFQDVLHELPEPVEALRRASRALRAGGTLAVFDWCMPADVESYRTPHGELLWGYQLDELYQGTSLLTREGFVELFRRAGLGDPTLSELEAGATVFVWRRGD
jgi:SAM-dependent methyltransferase